MLTRKEFIRRIALGSAVAPLLVQQLGCSSDSSQSATTSQAPADSARVAGRRARRPVLAVPAGRRHPRRTTPASPGRWATPPMAAPAPPRPS